MTNKQKNESPTCSIRLTGGGVVIVDHSEDEQEVPCNIVGDGIAIINKSEKIKYIPKNGDHIMAEALFYFSFVTHISHEELLAHVPQEKRASLELALSTVKEVHQVISKEGTGKHIAISDYPLLEALAETEDSVNVWRNHLVDLELLKSMWPAFARTKRFAQRLTDLNAPQLAELAAQPVRPYLSKPRQIPLPPAQ